MSKLLIIMFLLNGGRLLYMSCDLEILTIQFKAFLRWDGSEIRIVRFWKDICVI